MKRKRVPAQNPVLTPLRRWPRHLRPKTPCRHSPCSRSSSASSAPACEEASVQVMGLDMAGLTNPPLYRESSWHHSGERRGRVSSSRKVVRARVCPTRRGTSGIVPLSRVRVGFIVSSLISSLRCGSDYGELVPHFGPSLRWGTSDRGTRRKGRKSEQRETASARNNPGDRNSLRLEEPGDRSVHRRPRTRTEGIQRRRCDGRNDGGFDGFGLSDRSAACPEPLGELRRASRTPFIRCGTTDSEYSGSGCLGAPDAIPAMPLTPFVAVMLSTYPEAKWLASLMVAQEPTSEGVLAVGPGDSAA
jgi:hypothetical protein